MDTENNNNFDSRIHKFEFRGKKFVVDINGCNFFEVGCVIYDVVNFISKSFPLENIIQLLSCEYSQSEILEAVKMVENIRSKKMLFSDRESDISVDIHKFNEGRMNTLLLNIINDCNLRCKYCWNESGAYSGKDKGKKMTREIVLKAIDLLIKESKNSPSKEYYVDFYGGEPLLNFPVIQDTIEYCKIVKERTSKDFRFELTTNGTLLAPEIARYLLGNNVEVTISIDGPLEIHDKYRKFPSGNGSFTTIMRNINRLDPGIISNIGIRATLTPSDIYPDRVLEFLFNLGFKKIDIAPARELCFNLNNKKEFVFVSEGALKQYMDKLALYYLEHLLKGEDISIYRFKGIMRALYEAKKKYKACSAGRTMMAVVPSGEIYPCYSFIDVEEYEMGNVYEGINRDVQEKICNSFVFESKECQNCWIKYICGGIASCPANNYFLHKDIKTPCQLRCNEFEERVKWALFILSELAEKKPDMIKILFEKGQGNVECK